MTVLAGQWARSEVERGELLIGELRCTACHAAPEEVAARFESTDQPDLPARLARRPPGFVAEYLKSPRMLHPGGAMPDLFVRFTKAEKAQAIRALTAFLNAIVPPAVETPRPTHPIRFQQGRVLYHRVGCVACHPPFEPAGEVFELRGDGDQAAETVGGAWPESARVVVDLVEPRAQWTLSSLADFLLDPRRNEPRRRMPPMNLTDEQADAIAAYLLGREEGNGNDERGKSAGGLPTASDGRSADGLIAEGRVRFQELGCAACHRVEVDGEALASKLAAPPLTQLDEKAGQESCLSSSRPGAERCTGSAAAPGGPPDSPTQAPDTRLRGLAEETGGTPVLRYELSRVQADAIRAALRALKQGPTGLTPADRAHRTLATFNCLACHERGGRGGPNAEQAACFRTLATWDMGWEGWLPPHLNGVGAKLRAEWLQQTLAEGTRVRPYLATHMPTLDPSIAGTLVNDLRTADRRGDWRQEVPPGDASAAKGQELLGTEGLACVTCHRFQGRPGLTMNVLDLAWTRSRLEWPWFRRYLVDPSALRPGTRMPSFWPEGLSALPAILGGDTDRQIAAIWGALQEARSPDAESSTR